MPESNEIPDNYALWIEKVKGEVEEAKKDPRNRVKILVMDYCEAVNLGQIAPDIEGFLSDKEPLTTELQGYFKNLVAANMILGQFEDRMKYLQENS